MLVENRRSESTPP